MYSAFHYTSCQTYHSTPQPICVPNLSFLNINFIFHFKALTIEKNSAFFENCNVLSNNMIRGEQFGSELNSGNKKI